MWRRRVSEDSKILMCACYLMNISPHTWLQLQEELYVAALVDNLTLLRWGFEGFWCTLPVGVTQLNQGSTEAISRRVISIPKRMNVVVISWVASQSEREGRGGQCEAYTARQGVKEKMRMNMKMRGMLRARKLSDHFTGLDHYLQLFRHLWLT